MIRKFTIFFFHALFLTVPLFFTSINDELFEFNKIILTYAYTAIIVGLWVTRMIIEKKVLWKKTPFDIPLALFFISQLLSTIVSIHPHTSVFGYYSRFNGGLLSVMSYIALYYAFVNTIEKKDIGSFIKTLLYAGMLSAFYAFIEHFGHSPSCFFITGKFDVGCWIQDVQTRVFGTFGQPNWLAAYLIMLIPLAVSETIRAFEIKKSGYAWFLFGLVALLFSTLLFTQSRSGLLGLATGGFVYGILYIKRWFADTQARSSFRPLLLLGFSCAFLVFLFGSPLTPSARQLLQKFRTKPAVATPTAPTQQPAGTQLEVGGTESGAIRAIVWKGAIAVWKRYPLLGSGVETFAYSYYKDRPIEHNLVSEWDFLYNKAHNEFLNYLATTGAVGLGTYLLLIGWVYWWTLSHTGSSSSAMAWIAGYTALHVSNFFGFSTVVVSTLFFLVPAFVSVEFSPSEDLSTLPPWERKKKIRVRQEPVSLYQWSVIGLVSIGVFWALLTIVNMWRADYAFAQGKQLRAAKQGEQAIKKLKEAIDLGPNEAVFHEELSLTASELSAAAYAQQQATSAADLGELAIRESDKMLELNSSHLNFYKSRARMLITLSQIAPELMGEALRILDRAQVLAPTDAKLTYNRALLTEQGGKKDEAITLMKQAIDMKPNYEVAKEQLKRIEGR